MLTSDMVSETDADACNSCGICAERCIFRTREMAEGGSVYRPGQCFGCNLCVRTCPPGAIRMVGKNA